MESRFESWHPDSPTWSNGQGTRLRIARSGFDSLAVHCEDGTRFLFPRQDVCLLPIVHTSSEEVARYLLAHLRERLSEARGNSIQTIEVLIEDIPGQVAVCREEFAVG